MKEIRAYVDPFMLSKVTRVLEIPDFPGMSLSSCEGFGDVILIIGRDLPVSAKKVLKFLPQMNW